MNMDESVVKQISDVAPYMIAHLIMGRCRDSNLHHPHRRQDKTPGEYVAWLQKNSEGEAWNAVEESLKSYRVRKDGDTPLSPEYEAIAALSVSLRK